MAPPAWPATAPICFRRKAMTETGLHIPMTLPFGWERRSLARHELENLWGEALMILRVINQMVAHAPREGEADAALARLEAKVDLALHLLALNLHGRHVQSRSARITLGAEGCTLSTDPALPPGDEIVLGLYLSPALALPLKLAASVMASADGDTRVEWIDMPDAVKEAWEQWLFRQHRRKVQEQRGQK